MYFSVCKYALESTPYGRMSGNYPHDFKHNDAGITDTDDNDDDNYDNMIHRKGLLERRSQSICMSRISKQLCFA